MFERFGPFFLTFIVSFSMCSSLMGVAVVNSKELIRRRTSLDLDTTNYVGFLASNKYEL